MKESIAVIGAGTMGRGIAHVFAQVGCPVFVYDAVPADAGVKDGDKMRGEEQCRVPKVAAR